MKPQRRSNTKIQMKCHECQSACAPKDGDWHDGDHNQIFLCRSCGMKLAPKRANLRTQYFSSPVTA
jgi:hypothetical protein